MIAVANLAQTFQKTRFRRDTVHVAGNRLDNDACDLLAHLGKQRVDRIAVVVG